MSGEDYFVYTTDDGDNKLYFYNVKTQKRTYKLPCNARIYDPETCNLVYIVSEDDFQSSSSCSILSCDAFSEDSSFSYSKGSTDNSPRSSCKKTTFVKNEDDESTPKRGDQIRLAMSNDDIRKSKSKHHHHHHRNKSIGALDSTKSKHHRRKSSKKDIKEISKEIAEEQKENKTDHHHRRKSSNKDVEDISKEITKEPKEDHSKNSSNDATKVESDDEKEITINQEDYCSKRSQNLAQIPESEPKPMPEPVGNKSSPKRGIIQIPTNLPNYQVPLNAEEELWNLLDSVEFGMKNSVFNEDEILNAINKYPLSDYANSNFSLKESKGKIKKKSKSSKDDRFAYSEKPINSPLHKTVSKDKRSIVKEISKNILNYLGVLKNINQEQAAQTIVSALRKDEKLITEGYFLVLRMMTNNLNEKKAWELLLILSTLFPPSKDSSLYILSHIVRGCLSKNPEIQTIAKFTFIRFESTYYRGKLHKNDKYYKNVIQITQEPENPQQIFRCSLYEAMWSQSNLYPKCPFPYIIHIMAEAIIENDGLNQEGLFRLSGDLTKVKELSHQLTYSKDQFINNRIHDIASLFKKWFRTLPNPIVPYNMMKIFMAYCEQKEYIAFCYLLPKTRLISLMYLIGFLQECSKHESQTKMGVSNLALLFSPNVIHPPANSYPNLIQEVHVKGNDFLAHLLDNWDTSSIYPFPTDEFL